LALIESPYFVVKPPKPGEYLNRKFAKTISDCDKIETPQPKGCGSIHKKDTLQTAFLCYYYT